MASIISVTAKNKSGYEILVSSGILSTVGERVYPLTKATRVCIVSDSNVAPLYLKQVVDSFRDAGFTVSTFAFEAGEPHKTLETVNRIMQCFCMNQLTRADLAVALGGGVTGDMTGFAAAIYLRGIDFVQIPTSLLAQVDSSVGGKTGCDLPFGKNLCGAFHNPLAVYIDPETLKTLPNRYLKDGMAEAIKAGAIRLPKLFNLFESGEPNNLSDIICQSVQMKADIVSLDFTEQGERTLLNFGHTLGHAIERFQNFSGLSHGEAVSVGMVMITAASEAAGLTEKGTTNRLKTCLKKIGLPTQVDIPTGTLCELCLNDKKSRGKQIRLVLLKNIGDAFVHTIDWDRLPNFLSGGEC